MPRAPPAGEERCRRDDTTDDEPNEHPILPQLEGPDLDRQSVYCRLLFTAVLTASNAALTEVLFAPAEPSWVVRYP